MKTILLIGTLDTKGEELGYVRDLMMEQGFRVLIMDGGILGDPALLPAIGAAEVAEAGGGSLEELRREGDRGQALAVMARGAARLAAHYHADGLVDGVLGLGGSCGTVIATAAMRELPIGLPKVMISTVASGQVAPYVGVKDITMMYSVVDISGLNRISRKILANGAGAICGMLRQEVQEAEERPLVATTMFGVTTPCVERVRKRLEEAGLEVLVFHATGSGGRALEGLTAAGFIEGVVDVTTTELCDELVGGVLSAGPERLEAAGRRGVPQVVSCGALDMVNFGPLETVPEKFRSRNLYVHNESVTLMRTTAEESAQLGEILAAKLNGSTGPVTLLLPLRGLSMLDREGQPFFDPAANAALFDALRSHAGPGVELVELDCHLNDPEFADALADRFLKHFKGRINAFHQA
jgi:uncharacterized protein (UPF0261 family)